MKLISKEVEIPVSEQKINELAKEAAQLRAEADELGTKLHELTKQFKEENRKATEVIEQKENKISNYLRAVKSGKLLSMEKVIMVYDAQGSVVSYLWPHDAPEKDRIVVEQRPMTHDEYQLKLVDDGGEVEQTIPRE